MSLSFQKFDCAAKKPLPAEEQLAVLMIDFDNAVSPDCIMEIQKLEDCNEARVIWGRVISLLDGDNLNKLLVQTGFFDNRVCTILEFGGSGADGRNKSVEYLKAVCAGAFKGVNMPFKCSVRQGVLG